MRVRKYAVWTVVFLAGCGSGVIASSVARSLWWSNERWLATARGTLANGTTSHLLEGTVAGWEQHAIDRRLSLGGEGALLRGRSLELVRMQPDASLESFLDTVRKDSEASIVGWVADEWWLVVRQ